MAKTHILFYHKDCPNSQKFLRMLQPLPEKRNFEYVEITQASRLPKTLQGVPAIIPMGQTEQSLIQGSKCMQWLQMLESLRKETAATVSSSDPSSRPGGGGSGMVSGGGGSLLEAFNPNEMGMGKYSDKYSFIGSDEPMGHRYEFINGSRPTTMPGIQGSPVVSNIGNAIRNTATGMSEKQKELDEKYNSLMARRDEIPNGIKRIA
jgi:hypothetical protein